MSCKYNWTQNSNWKTRIFPGIVFVLAEKKDFKKDELGYVNDEWKSWISRRWVEFEERSRNLETPTWCLHYDLRKVLE